MSQKERTIQPSKEERQQTEPFQRTTDLAANQLNQAVTEETEKHPSLAVPETQGAQGKDDDDDDIDAAEDRHTSKATTDQHTSAKKAAPATKSAKKK